MSNYLTQNQNIIYCVILTVCHEHGRKIQTSGVFFTYIFYITIKKHPRDKEITATQMHQQFARYKME
jgi:hypothetical protein